MQTYKRSGWPSGLRRQTQDEILLVQRDKLMGVQALATYEVVLDNVQVNAGAKLGGAEGCNFDLILNYSRVALGAAAVGVARASYEYAREYAKERE